MAIRKSNLNKSKVKTKTIEDYQNEYNSAKATGDTSAMAAAHASADALRGYSTTTTKDSSGAYIQVPTSQSSAATPTVQTPTVQQPIVQQPITQPVTTAEDYYTNYMNEITASSQKAQQAAEEAQRLKTEAAVSANEAYIPQVQANTNEQLQQAYISAMKAKAQAPESLSAMGYTGGAAESSLLGLDTSYQNSRTDLQKSETEALNDIYANSANIQATGEASLADLSSTYYQNLLTSQQNALAQAQEQQNYQTQYDASQLEQEKADYANTISAYYQDYAAEKNKVLSDGDTSNDWKAALLEAARQEKLQALAAAQYEAEQQAIENAQAQQKVDYSTGKPYYNPSSGNKTSNMTYAQALALYRDGDRSAAVKKVLGID